MNEVGCDCIRVCMMEQRRKDVGKEKVEVDKIIQEAERAKLLIHKPTGRDGFDFDSFGKDDRLPCNTKLTHHYEIDEIYYQLGSHVTLFITQIALQ